MAENGVEQTSAPNEAHRDEVYSSSEDDREGRFRGPDSSWRFYTQEDRALVAALDQAENNDLSIHLYNAHKWKEQHRRPDLVDRDKSWLSKQTWLERNEQGKLPFLPEDSWTAWPLKPVDVPRSNEDWGVPIHDSATEATMYNERPPWRPGLDLEGSIRADILRQAKDSFRQRKWDQSSMSSQMSDASDSKSSQSPLSHTGGTASFLIDEDAAESITRSSAKSIVRDMEKVLTGLKRSRDGHYSAHSTSRSRLDKQASTRPEQALPADGIRKKRRADLVACRDDADVVREPSVDPEEHVEEEIRRARPSRRSSHRRRLGTRDWTEVLGVAALVSFDAAVVDRAATRCAALFSESMEMRMMPPIISSACGELRRYGPQMTLPDNDGLHQDPDPVASGQMQQRSNEQEQNRFNCPHEACPRHDNAYEQRWRLREHLRLQIDFEKLARLSGYTNVRSASNAWGAIKKKLASQANKAGAGDADVNGDNESATTPKTTPKKRGKKAADEDDGEQTPAKKTKGRKGKATPKKAGTDEDSGENGPVVKAEAEGDDDDDDDGDDGLL
ncbi:hypothetical protein AC579_10492 [Pseudocercospora musae]|uniref:Rrn9 domain-containing protein n=1 Tax=Pseudocercospora musae TaxID=113226 RepID=A0A139IB82_9PEZI|nr:hypothetical protein AC579_10492 [Pseudocercospora musae]